MANGLVQVLKRRLKSEDFVRVRSYARRIREIVGSYDRLRRFLGPVVLPMLWADEELRGAVALPNLRRLWINFDGFHGQALYPRMLMSPRVTSVVVEHTDRDTPGHELPWDNLAAVLVMAKSTLKCFAFETVYDNRVVSRYNSALDAAMISLPLFISLHNFDIHNFMISHAVLAHVARMPNIQSFSFGIKAPEAEQFLLTPAFAGDFPSLTELRIDAEGLDVVSRILERPGFGRLALLTVLRSKAVSGGSWDLEAFFKSLRDHQESPLTLKAIHILRVNASSSAPPRGQPLPLSYGALSYLFHFSQLSTLNITHELSLELSDEQFRALPEAWPRIRVLLLCADRRDVLLPSITFHAVLFFVCSCNELEVLKIQADATGFPSFAESGHIGTAPALRHLDMDTSPLDEPDEFATLLLMTCPALERLTYAKKYLRDLDYLSGVNRVYAKNWQRVSLRIKHMVSG
ncbi:hypothetical protein DXG01_015545 [Tephrocybe rancida]|nr:hypothetical protein DXG01_015545 [Tephrocybe rancida]